MFAKFLIGFCLVLDSEKFREVGLLDETLPGGDDLDLSIRLRKAGYKLVCDKTAYLHHIGSQTGNRVHSGYWNSDLQTDRSNNALIRKHGLKAWYELVSGDPLAMSLTPEVSKSRGREAQWVLEHTPDTGKGFSVGSGDKKIKGEYGLDRARVGEHGAGGRKFTGATNDTTGDANDLPLLDNSLDYMLALHIFEHLLDPFAVLKEWKRTLKPGGKLIIVCPNHLVLPTMMIDYTHLHAFTRDSLSAIIAAAGFTIETGEDFPVGTFGIVAYKPQIVETPELVFERIMGDG
jgi:SAM-dependent methyltransferase